METICVFCGSSAGARPEYAAAARILGNCLVAEGLSLVYGGGSTGLMGILADSVLEQGGEAIGVMPRALVEKEVAHSGLTEFRVVDSMHERKALMAEISDAFIALPGGFGTFEEFCEIVTWMQLGIQRKPCGLLNVAGYYDHLLAQFGHAVHEKFLKPANRDIVIAESDPAALLRRILTTDPPHLAKWMDIVAT